MKKMPSRKPYGRVVASASDHPGPTQVVGHIHGGFLLSDVRGRPKTVVIQHGDEVPRHELHISFDDSMFLLSIVKGIQLDCEIPFPDDPRGPADR